MWNGKKARKFLLVQQNNFFREISQAEAFEYFWNWKGFFYHRLTLHLIGWLYSVLSTLLWVFAISCWASTEVLGRHRFSRSFCLRLARQESRMRSPSAVKSFAKWGDTAFEIISVTSGFGFGGESTSSEFTLMAGGGENFGGVSLTSGVLQLLSPWKFSTWSRRSCGGWWWSQAVSMSRSNHLIRVEKAGLWSGFNSQHRKAKKSVDQIIAEDLRLRKLPILENISGHGSSVLQKTSMNCSLLRPKSEVRGIKSGSAWTRPMISHKMMPKLKMSTFSSYLNPRSISGAIQKGEPTT